MVDGRRRLDRRLHNRQKTEQSEGLTLQKLTGWVGKCQIKLAFKEFPSKSIVLPVMKALCKWGALPNCCWCCREQPGICITEQKTHTCCLFCCWCASSAGLGPFTCPLLLSISSNSILRLLTSKRFERFGLNRLSTRSLSDIPPLPPITLGQLTLSEDSNLPISVRTNVEKVNCVCAKNKKVSFFVVLNFEWFLA